MQYDNCDWRLGQEWPVLYIVTEKWARMLLMIIH